MSLKKLFFGIFIYKIKLNLMIKLLSAFIISVAFIRAITPQNLQIENEYDFGYYLISDIEVQLNQQSIILVRMNEPIYYEAIDGKKIFKSSAKDKFFFVSNFKFTDSKKDYPVEVKVFNADGISQFSYKFIAPYDLPHPIININDDGVLAVFNPLNFKLNVITQNSEKEIALEKEIEFEMERPAFVELDKNKIVIAVSKTALDITEDKPNTKIYQVNLADLELKAAELNFNTPVLLKLINDNIFISGVKFYNYEPIGKTVKLNYDLEETSSNDKILENLEFDSSHKFYGKYLNNIYLMDENLLLLKQISLQQAERAVSIKISNDKLFVLTSLGLNFFIYKLSPDLHIDFNMPLSNLELNKISDFSVFDDFIIFRQDNKSFRTKIN